MKFMHLVITLAVCIMASYLFAALAKRLRISSVVGLIISGIVIGSPALRDIVLEPSTELILSLGDAGLISLMFLAGMEISWRRFCKEKRDAAIVSVSAVMTPFLLGLVTFLALGFPLLVSLTVGICMSITAEATTAEVLLELKKIKTRLGSLMMGSGIIDDVIGMGLFVLVSYWFSESFMTRDLILLVGAILAFFSGIAAHRFIGREKYAISYLERFLLLFAIPFFFIAMGIHFSLESLNLNLLLLFVIIVIAIVGKIFGVLLAKPFTGLSLKQVYLVGWGMNSRGAVELAIAFVAFKVGLLDDIKIYSALIVMALFTTIVFPFFVRRITRKEPGIME
jgi:Kef-type K+ transport system membrane component KefB